MVSVKSLLCFALYGAAYALPFVPNSAAELSVPETKDLGLSDASLVETRSASLADSSVHHLNTRINKAHLFKIVWTIASFSKTITAVFTGDTFRIQDDGSTTIASTQLSEWTPQGTRKMYMYVDDKKTGFKGDVILLYNRKKEIVRILHENIEMKDGRPVPSHVKVERSHM